VEAVHIFSRVQRSHHSLLVKVARQRQLHQHAVNRCVCSYGCYGLLQLRLADCFWKANDPARKQSDNIARLCFDSA
jgi:hypothetical protein